MTIRELKNIFPYDLPNIPLTDSLTEEAIEETEKLRGKKWDQVEGVIIESFEMPCWLSPQAFHYYLPAYVVATQRDFWKSYLAVDYALSILRSPNNVNLLAWHTERWRLFSPVQWGLIKSWVNWLEIMAKEEPDFIKKISDVNIVINTQKIDSLGSYTFSGSSI